MNNAHAHQTIAGALYDFVGSLTSREGRIEVGAAVTPHQVQNLLGAWAETRQLSLGSPDIEGRQHALHLPDPSADEMGMMEGIDDFMPEPFPEPTRFIFDSRSGFRGEMDTEVQISSLEMKGERKTEDGRLPHAVMLVSRRRKDGEERIARYVRERRRENRASRRRGE